MKAIRFGTDLPVHQKLDSLLGIQLSPTLRICFLRQKFDSLFAGRKLISFVHIGAVYIITYPGNHRVLNQNPKGSKELESFINSFLDSQQARNCWSSCCCIWTIGDEENKTN